MMCCAGKLVHYLQCQSHRVWVRVSTLCANTYLVSVPPLCYHSGMYRTLVILPKVQVAGYT